MNDTSIKMQRRLSAKHNKPSFHSTLNAAHCFASLIQSSRSSSGSSFHCRSWPAPFVQHLHIELQMKTETGANMGQQSAQRSCYWQSVTSPTEQWCPPGCPHAARGKITGLGGRLRGPAHSPTPSRQSNITATALNCSCVQI